MDPGARTPSIRYGLANSREDLRGVLMGSIGVGEAIHSIDEWRSILPAGPELWELEGSEELELNIGGVFEEVRGINQFEFILLDLPPGRNSDFIEQGLGYSNWILSPTKAEADATSTLQTTMKLVWEAKRNGAFLRWLGVVVCLYRSGTTSSKAMFQELKKDLKGKVHLFDSVIPLSVVVPESGLYGSDPVSHAPNSKVGVRFVQLTEEILKIVDDDVKATAL